MSKETNKKKVVVDLQSPAYIKNITADKPWEDTILLLLATHDPGKGYKQVELMPGKTVQVTQKEIRDKKGELLEHLATLTKPRRTFPHAIISITDKLEDKKRKKKVSLKHVRPSAPAQKNILSDEKASAAGEDYKAISKNQLKDILDKSNIEYDNSMTKSELIALANEKVRLTDK